MVHDFDLSHPKSAGNSVNAYISQKITIRQKTWQGSVHPLGTTRHALKGPLFSTKFLPFALRSAPHIFNQLSEAIL